MLAGMDDDTPEDIPELLPPDEMPPITDQLTLHRTWRALMGPLGFARRQLWVMHVGADDRPLGVVQVDDVPAHLDPEHAELVVRTMAEATGAGEEVSFAFLLARPGRASRTTADLSWARGLTRACRAVGLRAWPVHLANDREIAVVAPDDLADAV
jgi:hypothetical protein